MNNVWAQLGLVTALVLLNGAFAGSEIALISLREGQLAVLEQRGAAGRAVVRLVREPNRFLATIQIGITLAGFLASATAAVTLAQPVARALTWMGEAAEPVAIIVVTAILAFFTLVLGELAPKRVAMQRAVSWALMAARPLEILATITRPVVWFLGVATDVVVRLLGADPDVVREDLSEEEVRELLSTHRALTPQQQAIVSGAFDSQTLTVRDVMVPRPRVIGLAASVPAAAATRQLLRSGRSRAPVYRESIDDAVGVVHLRDLVGADGTVGDHAAPVLVLPDSLGILDALRRMQRERQHLAVVVDEHGGVDGIVTLEDILEELVGEIYDESDPDPRRLERLPDGSIVVAGSTGIHDLAAWGVELPRGDYSTVGGLVTSLLGRLADPGDVVTAGAWTIEVVDVEGAAVERVRIAPREGDEADDSAEGSPR